MRLLLAVAALFATLVAGIKLKELERKENPGLTFTHAFPDNEFAIFPSGKAGRVHFNITNTGTAAKTITRVITTYYDAKDPKKKVSLSPWIELSKYIGAGQTVLFKHTFATDIEPQDANLEVLFDYDDIEESEEYRVLALNVPVKIIYNDSLFDAYSIMLYIWGTTLTGLVGYIFYLVFFSAEKPKPAKTKKPRAPVEPKEPVPPSTEPDMSWIPDHVVQGHKKAGSPKLKKRK